MGGQVDFIRAPRSERGRFDHRDAFDGPRRRGLAHRLLPEPRSRASWTSRADDFVATEYGIASLKGKTIRQRALALIGPAHPRFPRRAGRGSGQGRLPRRGQPAPTLSYRVELETRRAFGGDEIPVPPIKASDERRLRELFYRSPRRPR